MSLLSVFVFKGDKLVSKQELDNSRLQFVKSNVSVELDELEESLTVKYCSANEINSFLRNTQSKKKKNIKIDVNEVKLIEYVNEMFEGECEVDWLTETDLASYYNQTEINHINQNIEYFNSLSSIDKHNPNFEFNFPNEIPTKVKTCDSFRLVEEVVSTISLTTYSEEE